MGYSTMLHSILPYRCVLQVLRCSRRGGMRYPANPGILWNLHKQVPYGIQVCQDLREQVQSCSHTLRGALRSGICGYYYVACQVVYRVSHTLRSYGPS